MELYKINETNKHKYYQVPKELNDNPCYRYALTSDAKLIYAVLLDRMELSRKNNWVNDQGEIFLLYAKENIAEILGISERTVYRSFAVLEDVGLIKQERQGVNKPNKIYIGKVNYAFSIISMPQYKRTCQICRSGCAKSSDQDLPNMQGNYTDINETELSETERIHHLINNNDYFKFYFKLYEKKFNKKHPRITANQLEVIASDIEELQKLVDYSEWKGKVKEHFDNLPKRNNGNILAFLKASFRYFEVSTTQNVM